MGYDFWYNIRYNFRYNYRYNYRVWVPGAGTGYGCRVPVSLHWADFVFALLTRGFSGPCGITITSSSRRDPAPESGHA